MHSCILGQRSGQEQPYSCVIIFLLCNAASTPHTGKTAQEPTKAPGAMAGHAEGRPRDDSSVVRPFLHSRASEGVHAAPGSSINRKELAEGPWLRQD